MINTPDNHTGTSGAEGEADSHVSPIVRPETGAIPQPPPAHTEDNTPRKNRRWTKDPPMFWVTLAGVIVVIGYTSVAAWQAFLVQWQLDEMQIEQRPWVYAAHVVPAGRISLEDGRYFVPLKVSINNIGHRPAFSVVQKTDATIIKVGAAWSIRNEVCDNYRREAPAANVGDTIFPGQTITHGGFTHDDYPRVEKDKWDAVEDDRLIIIFGCIDYQFPADPGHHQSRFSFVVGERQDQGVLERIAPLPNDPTTVDIRLRPISIDSGVPAN